MSNHANLPNGNGNGNGNNVNGTNGNGNGNGATQEDPVANYSLQGVMQWLNGEYRRYERERNTWEIERASLVVCVSRRVVDVGSSFTFNGDESWHAEGSG
jgi:Striatin family